MIGDALSDASERILYWLEKYDYTDMRPQIAAVLLAMDKLRADLDSKGTAGAVARSFPTDPLAYLNELLAERAAEEVGRRAETCRQELDHSGWPEHIRRTIR